MGHPGQQEWLAIGMDPEESGKLRFAEGKSHQAHAGSTILDALLLATLKCGDPLQRFHVEKVLFPSAGEFIAN
jgi:hypothetical protein